MTLVINRDYRLRERFPEVNAQSSVMGFTWVARCTAALTKSMDFFIAWQEF